MVIDLQKTVLRKKVYSFLRTILFTIVLILLLFPGIFEEEIAGINKYSIAIFLVVVFVLFIIYEVLRNFQYVFYSDEGDKVILRYFNTGYFSNKKNSIEIKKALFSGYKIKKSLFGLREYLILSQKTKMGIANYPPVSITALTDAEKRKLQDSLSSLR